MDDDFGMRELIIVGFVIVFVNILIIKVHKDHQKKYGNPQVQQEVDMAVAKYFALKGEETKRSSEGIDF